MQDVGRWLDYLGYRELASVHYQHALAILRANRFPETHPDVKLCRDNLARVEALLADRRVT